MLCSKHSQVTIQEPLPCLEVAQCATAAMRCLAVAASCRSFRCFSDITRTPAEAGGAAEAAKTEWRNHELPWYAANTRIGSPALRLHNEIVELTHLLQPTATEDAQRREAHALLAAVVQEVFPGCTLEIFGSFATGLHLPTSDVDTVILESAVPDGQVALALRGLGRKLQPLSWVKDLEARPPACGAAATVDCRCCHPIAQALLLLSRASRSGCLVHL